MDIQATALSGSAQFFYLSVGELISNPPQYIFQNMGLQFMFNFVD